MRVMDRLTKSVTHLLDIQTFPGGVVMGGILGYRIRELMIVIPVLECHATCDIGGRRRRNKNSEGKVQHHSRELKTATWIGMIVQSISPLIAPR